MAMAIAIHQLDCNATVSMLTRMVGGLCDTQGGQLKAATANGWKRLRPLPALGPWMAATLERVGRASALHPWSSMMREANGGANSMLNLSDSKETHHNFSPPLKSDASLVASAVATMAMQGTLSITAAILAVAIP